jgi:hypothetical protein
LQEQLAAAEAAQAAADAAAADRLTLVEEELSYAVVAGFNTVRTFLAWLPWRKDAAAFTANLAHFIRALEARNLTSQLVVFDSCCCDADANVSWIDSGFYRNHSWFPNPGPAMVASSATWPLLDAYLADVVATVGCQQPSQPIVNEWWSFDDDVYRKSVNIQCVTTFGPPDVGRNAYDVWHVYADSTCGTTTAGGSNDYALFEAYVLDTCIPIQVFYTRTDDRSASFAYDSATQQMYAKIYNQNRDCSGAYTTVDFDAECAAGGNAVMSYEWGYDAGEKKGGKVVKSASPRPQ